MSPIRELLEGVSATGTLPSEADLAAALPSTASASGRLGDKRGLLTEARKVKALRGPHAESDDPDAEIAEIIEAAEEKFSAGLADRLADQIRGLDNSSGAIERRRQQAQLQRKTVAPLAELLALAGKGDGVDMREVDRLALREGVSAEERNAWRQKVAAAGRRVATIYKSGALQNSRVVAQAAADELGDVLAPPRHVDPLADVDDPRQLADAIFARRRGE